VLVVDDSAVVRTKLKRLLEGAGYAVDLAHDGVQALERLQHDSGYALLVTDLEMPQMDGFELIASVQGSLATEDLPIIAITGHEALSARVHDCQGLYGIFRKPWNDRELLKRVATVARLHSGSTV
jgi:CheY-like chemotaxis protein